MALTEIQTRSLQAKLKRRYVRTRESSGASLSYIEGWHAISEANRIFGFDSWDRQTLSPRCHWTQVRASETVCFYSTKVRVTVRAGDTVTVREGMGTGFGRAPQPELAHDMALKAAETDATKRALATFGNPFGLALYDRDQSHVTKARTQAPIADRPTQPCVAFTLVDNEGVTRQFQGHTDFVAEALRQIELLDTVEAVYAFWSRNSAAFGKLRAESHKGDPTARQLVEALKERARHVGIPPKRDLADASDRQTSLVRVERPENAVLVPKEKRLRNRAHLAFVASQPCLICGRRPAQAHHIRFAQPQAMAMKVSDEFTVPLCNTHHDQLHRGGNERAFWGRNGIPDPLKFAARLWESSRDQRRGLINHGEGFDPDLEPEFSEPNLKRIGKGEVPSI